MQATVGAMRPSAAAVAATMRIARASRCVRMMQCAFSTTPSAPPKASPSAGGAPRTPKPTSSNSSNSSLHSKPSFAPLKGMHDLLPAEAAQYRALTTSFERVLSSFGYSEVRTPLLERLDLFARGLGDTSDVVAKEMFAFDDHGTWSVLRPEATASVARALMDEGLGSLALPVRLYYSGPMFRRERPQAGRSRQFHQFGLELVGGGEPAADVECIECAVECLRAAGLLPYVTLQINSLGDAASRAAYSTALTAFLQKHADALSADSRARLERGAVLRVLDSKDKGDQEILTGSGGEERQPAPQLSQYLNSASRQRFSEVLRGLQAAGISYSVNPFLVRGLDYYSHACFEFVLDPSAIEAHLKRVGGPRATSKLPAQSTVLAGGRYDGLFTTLGGPATPAVGWAAGQERMLLLQALVGVRVPVEPRVTPIGVVMIEEAEPAPDQQREAGEAARPPSVAAAHSALCTYIRRGCTLATSSSSSSSPSPPSPSPPLYSIVRSFHPSMSKQLKHITRALPPPPTTTAATSTPAAAASSTPSSSSASASSSTAPVVELVLIVGKKEVEQGCVRVKKLSDGSQAEVQLKDLAAVLREGTFTNAAREAAAAASVGQNESAGLTYSQLIAAIQTSSSSSSSSSSSVKHARLPFAFLAILAGGSLVATATGAAATSTEEASAASAASNETSSGTPTPAAADDDDSTTVSITGGCHCGGVRFTGRCARSVTVLDCNCSICSATGFLHLVVPHGDFVLHTPADELTSYRFGTRRADHLFCRTCGIKSFYQPRSHPNAWSVNVHTLTDESRQKLTITIQPFDGKDWEAAKAKLAD